MLLLLTECVHLRIGASVRLSLGDLGAVHSVTLLAERRQHKVETVDGLAPSIKRLQAALRGVHRLRVGVISAARAHGTADRLLQRLFVGAILLLLLLD